MKTKVVILVAIAISTIVIAINAITPTILEVEYAISDITYARDIHQWYIDNGYEGVSFSDLEWDQEWVRSYNKTLDVLESYKQLLLILGKQNFFINRGSMSPTLVEEGLNE